MVVDQLRNAEKLFAFGPHGARHIVGDQRQIPLHVQSTAGSPLDGGGHTCLLITQLLAISHGAAVVGNILGRILVRGRRLVQEDGNTNDVAQLIGQGGIFAFLFVDLTQYRYVQRAGIQIFQLQLPTAGSPVSRPTGNGQGHDHGQRQQHGEELSPGVPHAFFLLWSDIGL